MGQEIIQIQIDLAILLPPVLTIREGRFFDQSRIYGAGKSPGKLRGNLSIAIEPEVPDVGAIVLRKITSQTGRKNILQKQDR